MNHDTATEPARKPHVGGTEHSTVDNGAVSSMDCAKLGGTAFVTGVALMATWKGLTKWLG